MSKGQEATLTFDYEGNVTSADDSPVPGLRLAYVGDPITYLLYSGRWFPVTNYGIDRFTARLKITAPQEYTVISSGGASPAHADAQAERAPKPPPRTSTPAPKLQTREKAAKKPATAAPAKSAARQVRARHEDVHFQLDQAELSRHRGDRKICRYPGERSRDDRPCLFPEGQSRALRSSMARPRPKSWVSSSPFMAFPSARS